jgi:hypothetical protein
MIKATFRERLAKKAMRTIAAAQYDWREAIEHVTQGMHSEIPTCCIVFFVMEWLPWQHAFKTQHPHMQELLFVGLRPGRKTAPEYVPCPDCLVRRHFVDIHICTPACKGVVGASPSTERGACTDPDKMHGVGDEFPGSDY